MLILLLSGFIFDYFYIFAAFYERLPKPEPWVALKLPLEILMPLWLPRVLPFIFLFLRLIASRTFEVSVWNSSMRPWMSLDIPLELLGPPPLKTLPTLFPVKKKEPLVVDIPPAFALCDYWSLLFVFIIFKDEPWPLTYVLCSWLFSSYSISSSIFILSF